MVVVLVPVVPGGVDGGMSKKGEGVVEPPAELFWSFLYSSLLFLSTGRPVDIVLPDAMKAPQSAERTIWGPKRRSFGGRLRRKRHFLKDIAFAL